MMKTIPRQAWEGTLLRLGPATQKSPRNQSLRWDMTDLRARIIASCVCQPPERFFVMVHRKSNARSCTTRCSYLLFRFKILRRKQLTSKGGGNPPKNVTSQASREVTSTSTRYPNLKQTRDVLCDLIYYGNVFEWFCEKRRLLTRTTISEDKFSERF